jgi:hypothetical protein
LLVLVTISRATIIVSGLPESALSEVGILVLQVEELSSGLSALRRTIFPKKYNNPNWIAWFEQEIEKLTTSL